MERRPATQGVPPRRDGRYISSVLTAEERHSKETVSKNHNAGIFFLKEEMSNAVYVSLVERRSNATI
jgi:hypothetical protein